MKLKRVMLCGAVLLFVLKFVFSPCLSIADPLDVWHSRSPSLTVNSLNGIAYGNGTFIAVGNGGTTLASPDGINWVTSTSGTINDLRRVAFGNGIFVAVGSGGSILTSSDTINWTMRVSGTGAPLRAVTFGNGLFIVVGDGGTILTSPDSVNWTPQTSGVTDGLRGVAFGNGVFAVVGATMLVSSDGITWAVGEKLWDIYDVAFGNGTFVAVGGGPILTTGPPTYQETFATSPNGQNWTIKRESGFPLISLTLLGVAFGNGRFVAVGEQSRIRTSSDGLNWTAQNSGSNSPLLGIAYGNRSFVSVGTNGIILQSDQFLFGDIASGHWAESFITALYNSGITGGCGNGNYCPDDPISRGQMAVFLVTSLGQSPVTCTGRFVDVPIGHPFCGFIEQMFSGGAGITAGCDFRGPTFCVDEPVTRTQMAVFIEAALGNPPNICTATRFTDVTPVALGDAFCGFIERLADDGITGGCTPTTFCPNDPVTRAQMAVFLVAAPSPLSP